MLLFLRTLTILVSSFAGLLALFEFVRTSHKKSTWHRATAPFKLMYLGIATSQLASVIFRIIDINKAAGVSARDFTGLATGLIFATAMALRVNMRVTELPSPS